MNTKKEASYPSKSCRDRSLTEASSSMDSNIISSSATAASFSDLPRWFPRCCGKPILHGKPEALGWMIGMTGQTLGVLGVLTFVAPALLYFAKLEAGCAVEAPEGETEIPECHETVHGMKPSSLITTLVGVVSLLVAMLTPLMGAIIDFTPHRRRIGRILAFSYMLTVVPHIFISESTWFPLAICLLLMAIAGVTLTLCLHSYLPELTDQEEELNDLTKAFVAVPGGAVIVFIILVLAITTGLGLNGDEGATAQIAAILGVVCIGSALFLAWGVLLQDRPAAHTLPEGQSMVTAGFKQIYQTTKKLYNTNVAMLWFFSAVALGDVKPLTSIALTFLSSQQQFTSQDIGIAALTMLFTVIPGAIFSGWVCRRVNPIRSSVLCLLSMVTVTLAASAFLTGGGQKLQTYCVVAFWGLIGGWKVTTTAMLVAAIVPEGQDAELMGFYLFADISLTWLPPILFTVINEAGMSERVGLASICIFFLLSLVGYWKMGSYEDCVKAANRLTVVAPADTLEASVDDEEDPDTPTPIPTSEATEAEVTKHPGNTPPVSALLLLSGEL